MSLFRAREQLELRLLELEVAGGRDVENEAEVDVDEVAEIIDQNVSIVSVLDLQHVGDDGVGGHRLDEVLLGDLEEFGGSAELTRRQICP